MSSQKDLTKVWNAYLSRDLTLDSFPRNSMRTAEMLWDQFGTTRSARS
jgi:hypothetical protein